MGPSKLLEMKTIFVFAVCSQMRRRQQRQCQGPLPPPSRTQSLRRCCQRRCVLRPCVPLGLGLDLCIPLKPHQGHHITPLQTPWPGQRQRRQSLQQPHQHECIAWIVHRSSSQAHSMYKLGYAWRDAVFAFVLLAFVCPVCMRLY